MMIRETFPARVLLREVKIGLQAGCPPGPNLPVSDVFKIQQCRSRSLHNCFNKMKLTYFAVYCCIRKSLIWKVEQCFNTSHVCYRSRVYYKLRVLGHSSNRSQGLVLEVLWYRIQF